MYVDIQRKIKSLLKPALTVLGQTGFNVIFGTLGVATVAFTAIGLGILAINAVVLVPFLLGTTAIGIGVALLFVLLASATVAVVSLAQALVYGLKAANQSLYSGNTKHQKQIGDSQPESQESLDHSLKAADKSRNQGAILFNTNPLKSEKKYPNLSSSNSEIGKKPNNPNNKKNQ